MDFQRVIIWILFALCLSLTAGGILSIFRFERSKLIPAAKYMQYFLILANTFGYYVLWSEVFIGFLPEKQGLFRISKIISLMGLPFLLLSMLMLLFWLKNLSQKIISTTLVFVLALSLIGGIMFWSYFTNFDVLSTIPMVYNAFALGIWLVAILLFSFLKVKILESRPKKALSVIMMMAIFLHLSFFMKIEFNELALPIFNFLFFLIYTSLVVIFVYTVKVESSLEEESGFHIEIFAQKFNITTREKEIIEELVKGKTNQEIADALFISLQTVKDHTSRIYLKTHLKNRTQLISKLRVQG